MKKVFAFIILITLQSCYVINCKVLKNCISKVENISNIKESYLLEDYNWYVFQMYENKNEFFDDESTSQDLAHPSFGITEKPQSKIAEETYLLVPKDSNNNVILYLTTFSHRHIFENCGIFNCPQLKNKVVFIEDIDKVYTGNIYDNRINFYERGKNSRFPDVIWNISINSNSLIVKNVTLHPSSFKSAPQVDISSVFPFEMVFNLQQREIIYGKGDKRYNFCFSECENSLQISKPSYENIGVPVSEIKLSKNKFYFSNIKDGVKENYGFSMKRMPLIHR